MHQAGQGLAVQLPLVLLVVLVVLNLTLSVVAQEPCTSADYEAQYSQCRPSYTHDLIWYKMRNSTCVGGEPVPAAIFDLPCNTTCGMGQYLPLGGLSCAACSPGTYSLGGGRTVDTWSTWPTELGIFSTSCFNKNIPANCSGWTLTGTTVRSGPITHVQSSVLLLQTQLLIGGYVRFSYRVDAEPVWDGLIFSVDGTVLLPKVSVTSFYRDFTANLTAGFHTLKWEYYKDVSDSRGEDAAFIRSIQISGLSYAESSCTECPAGTAAAASGSTQCSACPLNTVATEEGSSVCQPCPDGQYSYVGASSCIPKIPCTEKDYQMLYGPCSSGTRVIKASWLEPHVCDDTDFQLPERNEGCAACPAGTQPDASLNCVPCASGFYSAGGGAPCQECVAGSAAARVLNISTFDSWTTNMSTSCTGDCGSNGWRLRSGFIDSGAGHGNEVDSVLALDVVLEQPGSVTFTFVLNCSRFCALYYLDFPYDASVSWNTTTSRNKVITHTRPIEAGTHRLTWNFEEDAYDPTPNNRTDAVKIYSISITGTTTGGAPACQACGNGSIAGARASFCTNCTSGYSSDPSRTQCTQCPGNTFSRDEGLLCSECGPTTTANSNHSDCTDTCSFSLGGFNYSLAPLSGKAFGPVKYDIYSYYFNLCGRGNFIPDCHDVDDNPLITKVCQILPYGYALDVGWSSGYYPLASGARGFRVHYDLGAMGCGPRNNGVAYPRNSDINFICDPSAGTGAVASNGPVEDRPCHYNFEWRSIYACPVCSEADYSFYYTNCDSSGRRTKVYYWKDPILCRDGVTLPLAEQVPCSDSTQICPVGQRLGDDSKSCTSCAVGEYSVGGGVLYSRNWPVGDLPDGFASPCISAGCTSWSSEDGLSIHSGFGNSSLVGSFAFRTQGSISFKYKVYLESDGYFSFSIDGQTVIRSSGQSRYDWVLFTQNLRPGSHVFQWTFANGKRFSPALGGYQAVVVSDVYIQGLDFHADSCLPCPDGTYSTNSSSVLGCTPCPAGNYSSIQSNVCAACPASQYSIAGSSNCIAKTPCTIASYVPVYTECFNGKRNVSYSKALPDTCSGGVGSPPARVGIACAACPLYTLPQGDSCVPCPAGQVLTAGVCVANVAGNIIHRTQVYFGDNSLSKWPSNFFTGCTGSCGSNGWRILDGAIDSGFHSTNTIDSFVGLVADFEYHGSVSFVVSQSTVNPGTLSGLTFTVDDRYIQIPVALNQTQNMTVNVDIIQGHRVLKWNFHQEGTSGGARISNIVLHGVESGAAGSALPCPAGSFSSDVAATTCNVCPPGTYSKDAGSSSCISCPVNTYNPNYGATQCMPCEFGSYANVNGSLLCSTTCQFTLDTGDSFDLTTLPGPITVYDDYRKKYLINVCKTLERCPNSHSCIINVDDTTLEAGNSIKVVPDSSNSTATPFAIHFEHGALCHASSNERATVIEFQCDTESPSNFPAFIDEDDDCVATFAWRTLAACRKCTDADYTVVRGACSGGRRTMSKTRVKSCNGEAYVALEEEKCSGREVNLAVILVVVFALVAVVAVAAFIFFRNRRLSARYNALVEETRSSNVTL